jgi:phosphoserine aminotransferase
MQFAMLPMNFLHTKADYLNTGEWSRKAIKEAKMFGEVCVVGFRKNRTTFYSEELQWSADADYAHITTTILFLALALKIFRCRFCAARSRYVVDFLSRRLDIPSST